MTELTTEDKSMIEALKDDADSGNIKKYIDGMNQFVAKQGTDLPTMTDDSGSIVDKHAIIDMARGYHDSMMNSCRQKVNAHPDIEYWFNDGHKFVPLDTSIMMGLLHDCIRYIVTHYDRFDNEQNPNVNDPIGQLKDTMK